MTDQQLYLVTGIPSLVTLAGILVNIWFFSAILRTLDRVDSDGKLNYSEERLKH